LRKYVLRENISERKADMSVREFVKHQFRHFNAAVVVDASEAYIAHLARGGKMFLTMAGAQRSWASRSRK
jgi:hypothetical protein